MDAKDLNTAVATMDADKQRILLCALYSLCTHDDSTGWISNAAEMLLETFLAEQD